MIKQWLLELVPCFCFCKQSSKRTKYIQLHGACYKRGNTPEADSIFFIIPCQIRWNLLCKLQTAREWKHNVVHILKLKPPCSTAAYTLGYMDSSFCLRKRFAAHCAIIISWYEVKIPMDTGKRWLKLHTSTRPLQLCYHLWEDTQSSHLNSYTHIQCHAKGSYEVKNGTDSQSWSVHLLDFIQLKHISAFCLSSWDRILPLPRCRQSQTNCWSDKEIKYPVGFIRDR